MRREIPLFITFIVGLLMIVSYFVPHAPFDMLDQEITTIFNIVAAFALILGAGDLLKVHTRKVTKQSEGWGFSAVTVLAFWITFIVGVFKTGNPGGIQGAVDADGSHFDWMFDNFFMPLSATMFSLLAFYVASASYRAFRARNREATVLLVAAFIVLMGRTFVGTYLTNYIPLVELAFIGVFGYLAFEAYKSKKMVLAGSMGLISGFFLYALFALERITIPALLNWIMIYPQTAGQRAIMIGIALGIVSMSLRIILGIERSHIGSDTE